jgi:hypothetical protein
MIRTDPTNSIRPEAATSSLGGNDGPLLGADSRAVLWSLGDALDRQERVQVSGSGAADAIGGVARMSSTMLRRCRGYVSSTYRQDPHELPDDAEHFYAGKTQCRTCYLAYAADWRAGRSGGQHAPRTSARASAASSLGAARREPILDGAAQLEALLRRARYPSVAAAVAAHAVFLHPATVSQARGYALFPVVRDMVRRGSFDVLLDGRRVLLDDNTSPTCAFLWAAGRSKGPDVQFNHIWTASGDPDAYTALWNLCATPAFLAKTTDGSRHDDVTSVLRFRAFELFGCHPAGTPAPTEPPGYRDLSWAPHPRPVENLERELRARLATNAKSRPAKACREIGWLFSVGHPDPTL